MANTHTKRQWSPYELNQLARSGLAARAGKIKTEIPVEYITGQVDFCGWSVKVSPDVLIPRVESEKLVDLGELAIKKLQRSEVQVVEVGTGSGAIGLSLWKKLNQIGFSQKVNFNLLDLSQAALEVSRLNLDLLKLELPTLINLPYPTLSMSDLLLGWPITKKIDLLIANLPYIPSNNLKKLPKSVIDYEPIMALDGGSDGLSLIARLLTQAEALLSFGAEILLEVDDSHTLDNFNRLNQNYKYKQIRDCFDKPRFVLAQLNSQSKN